MINLRTTAEKQREAAIQHRLQAIAEGKLSKQITKELRRLAISAKSAFNAGGQTGVQQIIPAHRKNVQAIIERALVPLMLTFSSRLLRIVSEKNLKYRETKDLSSSMDLFISDFIAENTTKTALSITSTSLRQINAIIEKAASQGIPESKIGPLLEKRIKESSPARARMIARTESHNASQGATMRMGNEILPSTATKEWVTAGDERVRLQDSNGVSMHVLANGQIQPMNDPFQITMPDGSTESLMFPGDSSLGASAENIINCRCVVVFNAAEIEELPA